MEIYINKMNMSHIDIYNEDAEFLDENSLKDTYLHSKESEIYLSAGTENEYLINRIKNLEKEKTELQEKNEKLQISLKKENDDNYILNKENQNLSFFLDKNKEKLEETKDILNKMENNFHFVCDVINKIYEKYDNKIEFLKIVLSSNHKEFKLPINVVFEHYYNKIKNVALVELQEE